MCVGLTPAGHLRWAPRDGDTIPAGIALLKSAFAADWREALFSLAAGRINTEGSPAARFWRQVPERYLTALCQLPGHQMGISPNIVRASHPKNAAFAATSAALNSLRCRRIATEATR